MKKLFGGINLTWKRLIIFAIISAVYTALMAIIPITKETSFRDIAIQFEWWIFFGIIIIHNSESNLDSALKCFVFFLISQPLIYLFQVPFSYMGWNLFRYYRYLFIWTLFTFPMGFIGYYIKKKNILSLIILLPMLILLAYHGLGYLNSTLVDFPHHLLSFIICFLMIIVIVFYTFDKNKYRMITWGIIIMSMVGMILLKGGIQNSEYETVRSLSEYNLELNDNAYIANFTKTNRGNVSIFPYENSYNVRLNGLENEKYTFTITDDVKEYEFEYYFDKNQKTIVLQMIK